MRFPQERGLESPLSVWNEPDFGAGSARLTRAAGASPPCARGCGRGRAACTGRAARCSECSGNAWSCSPERSWVQTRQDPDAGNKCPLLYLQLLKSSLPKAVSERLELRGAAWCWGLLSGAVTCPSLPVHQDYSRIHPGSCQGAPRAQPGGSHSVPWW